MEVSKNIRYIGVNDHQVDLFEGQFPVPEGMAYNSYLILDEKPTVMDSVDAHFTEEWLSNLERELEGRQPAYLVVQHMEPDHSGSLKAFADKYPEAVIVSSMAAFRMMKNYFGTDYADRRVLAAEGQTLSLGSHELQFVAAPMVHWPEVTMTYEKTEKVLFSADAFGKFGALDVESDEEDLDEKWACEARRYYFGIVGKFGPQVQNLLKKAAGLDIRCICPLHGPVLNEELGYYLQKYQTWSAYAAESEGVFIAYTSVYGHTKAAVELFAKMLEDQGCPKVVVTDLARCDVFEAVEDAFRYGKIVLASTTYNGEVYPFMREFIGHLTERAWQKRKVGLIENGSWGPMAAKTIQKLLEGAKDVTFADSKVTILGAMNDANIIQLQNLAAEMLKD